MNSIKGFTMRLTAYQTAILLALLFKRAQEKRARLSETTIKKLSGRVKLRSAFIREVQDALDDLGFAFVEIERGYAILPMSALNGAPSITAKRFLPEISSQISEGSLSDFARYEKELEPKDDEIDHDEEM